MNILAIDTSTEACSVALMFGAKELSQFQLAVRQHANIILAMVDTLLKNAQLSLLELDAIAFGRGPGSFTGLRIAASVTQGLALAHDIPVIALSTLQTLAQGAWHEFKATKVLSAIDARMQQVYWGQYQLHNNIMQLIGEEQVIAPDNLAPIEGDNYYGIGTGWTAYATLLQAQFAGNLCKIAGERYPLAKDMLSIAQYYLQQGKVMKAEQAIPVYIRNKVTQRE